MQITKQHAVLANLGSRYRQFALCIEGYADGTFKVAWGYPVVVLGNMLTHSVHCLCGDLRIGALVLTPETYISMWRSLLERAGDVDEGAEMLRGLIIEVRIDAESSSWRYEQMRLAESYHHILDLLPGEDDGQIIACFDAGDAEQLFAALVLAASRAELSVRNALPPEVADMTFELEQKSLF